MRKPETGGIYKHFKGNQYRVIATVRHSETNEEMVLYMPLHLNEDFPGQMWVRPLKMFAEKIERDGKKIKRFTLVK